MPKNSNFKWDEDDILELLAYNDHCIAHRLDFQGTAVAHLKAIIGSDLTIGQINRKLDWAWNHYGRYGTKIQDIYKNGSKSLARESIDHYGLTDEDLGGIKERVDRLEELYRSTPSDTMSELSSTPDFDIPSGYVTAQSDDVPHEDCAGTPLWRTAPVDMDNALSEPGCTSDEVAGKYEPGDRLVQQKLEEELRETRALLLQAEAVKKNQKSMIFSLRAEVARLRKQYEKARQGLAEGRRHDPPRTGSLLAEISLLKDMQKRVYDVQTDKKMLESGTLAPTDRRIQATLITIERRIAEACSPLAMSSSPLRPVQFEPSKSTIHLGLLVEKISNMEINGFVGFALDKGLEKAKLLQSITAASVCVSAFESDFPNFLGRDLLLEKYRELILTQDGASSLRILDTLAHKSLISEDFFKHDIIKDEAQEQAAVVSEALKPFLDPDPNVHEQGAIQSEFMADSDEEFCDADYMPLVPLASSLSEIFEYALKLKSELFLSDKHYQLFFPQPNDRFDAETMRDISQIEHPESQKRLKESSRIGFSVVEQRVALTIFPGLYSNAPGIIREAGNESEVRDVVISYKNFSADKGTNSLPGRVLVAKAVVVMSKYDED